MAVINVVVNDRSYAVSCDEGQEDHLRGLAQDFDRRVRALAGAVGQIGDMRLLLIAALTVLDELSEAKDALAAAKAKENTVQNSEDSLAELLENATSRLEAIAARIAQS